MRDAVAASVRNLRGMYDKVLALGYKEFNNIPIRQGVPKVLIEASNKNM